MNDGLLAYFHNDKLLCWLEPGHESVRLRIRGDRPEILPDTASDDISGDGHDIALTCADGGCRITDRGRIGALSLERRGTYAPRSHETGAGRNSREQLHIGDMRLLEDGDILRFGSAHIKYIATSRYLRYLPIPYHPSEPNKLTQITTGREPDEMRQFTGRFLMIFESILDPIAQIIAQVDQYVGPTAPTSLLPYLLSWFGLLPDVPLDPDRQRDLLSNALEIDRWRSTRRGLSLHIKACCGIDPEIVEWSAVPFGDEARQEEDLFNVVVPIDGQLPASEQVMKTVDAIVRMHQPVRTRYRIWFRQNNQLRRWIEDAPDKRGAR
jgi:phage tail-like protein